MATEQTPAAAPEAAPTITQDGGVTRFTPPQEVTTGEAPTPAAPERPTEWPEGVNSWEDFGKLSAEDRAKALAPKPEAAAEGTTPEPLTEDQQKVLDTSLEGVAPEMAEKAKPFVEAFIRNGALSDAEVTEAAKATGFSEAMVRQYMRGGDETIVSAAEAAQTAPFLDLAGGADQWGEFQAFAAESLTAADHTAINKALDEGRPQDVQPFIDRWKNGGGGAAARDLSRAASGDHGSGAAGFASLAEQKRAQSDPRYANDPAYREEVIRKIAASAF